MKEFNGTVLRDIREAAGLSRKELASKINVSEQSIGQYENGITTPNFLALSRIKNLFSVELSFFQSKKSFDREFSINQVAFRSVYKSSIKKSSREVSYLNMVDYCIRLAVEGINMPNEILTSLCETVRDMRVHGYDINTIGHIVRKYIGIDNNNKKVIPAIEKAGAYIVEREVQDDVDAYSGWSDGGLPIIVLGSSKKVAVRRNFDVSHELGHLLLHRDLNMAEMDSLHYRYIERQADEFASAFLLDKDTFINAYQKIRDKSNPDEYIPLKLYFNTSIQSICMRANSLGLIDKKTFRYFWGKLNKKNYKKYEPYDSEISITPPGKIKAIINMRELHHLTSLSKMLSVKPKFLYDFGIYRRTLKKQNINKSKKDNVLDIHNYL